MLETQRWMNFAQSLMLEWKQCRDEGKDVAHLRQMCEDITVLAKTQRCDEQAAAINLLLEKAPVFEDHPFDEPSDLEGILSARPKARTEFAAPDRQTLEDKVRGAWIGRISGCLLGKPVEGYKRPLLEKTLRTTGNYPLERYLYSNEFPEDLQAELEAFSPNRCWADTVKDHAPIDDDTNYTVLALKLIRQFGKDFVPNDVLEAWLRWMPMLVTCTAERVAYRNAAMGMVAPQTATYHNPFRERIGAQIRGDFFGYIYPGNPEAAAKMAWRDAAISHVRNGIYGEMVVAAMLAAAAVSKDMKTVITAGLEQIPEKCRLRRDIDKVLAWYEQGLTAEETIDRIHQTYDEMDVHNWSHTLSNAMVVVMALLYGKQDFQKTICLSVQAAYDTDCNGATAGSILGMMIGADAIPPYWYELYHLKLETSIEGYEMMTVDELVKQTLALID